VPGVGGGPIRTLACGGLAAAVSTVSLAEFGEEALPGRLEDLAWLEAVARLHHRVIEIAANHVPVVPMRLATVYRSHARVTAMMAARQADFTTALGRVRARTEWGVKVYTSSPGPAAESGGDDSAAGPGAAYLRQRRRQLDASNQAKRAAAASAERIHAALGRLAAAAELRAPQAPQLTGRPDRMILNGAYLVDDERSAEFTTAVERAAGEHEQLQVELTGPWPPYSFAVADGPGGERRAGG
jgi:hypothetical protein